MPLVVIDCLFLSSFVVRHGLPMSCFRGLGQMSRRALGPSLPSYPCLSHARQLTQLGLMFAVRVCGFVHFGAPFGSGAAGAACSWFTRLRRDVNPASAQYGMQQHALTEWLLFIPLHSAGSLRRTSTASGRAMRRLTPTAPEVWCGVCPCPCVRLCIGLGGHFLPSFFRRDFLPLLTSVLVFSPLFFF